jgi:transcription initiation factor IIE alpha subunit
MLFIRKFFCECAHPKRAILIDNNDDIKDYERYRCPKCGAEVVAVGTEPVSTRKAVIRIENAEHYNKRRDRYEGEKSYYIVITDWQGEEHCRAAHPVSWHKLVRHLEQLREMDIENAIKYMKREKLTI